MSSMPIPRKIVLMIEDEPDICEAIKKIFEPYGDLVVLKFADTAKAAIEILDQDKKTITGIILDIMLPYGNSKTRETLQGEGDDSSIKTGIYLLELIRKKEAEEKRSPVWVNVITGRNAPDVLNHLTLLLKDRGRLLLKPFNDFVLENDIVSVLGIDSKVPEILLPQNYEPPKPLEENYEA